MWVLHSMSLILRKPHANREVEMKRNALYVVIGLLAVGIIVIGYMYYQESRSGINIRIGDHGVTIQGN